MSLVICFSGKKGAIIAGDMREILFGGDDDAIAALEKDLYSGAVTTEGDLQERARSLGVTIVIRDGREKVSSRGDILIGEVGERERDRVRKRCVYATAGSYALVEMHDSRMISAERREGAGFVVLGNEITKRIAHQCIRDYWKAGTLDDAVRVIVMAMETASRATPTVSKQYSLLQTRGRGDLLALLEEEKRSGLIPDESR